MNRSTGVALLLVCLGLAITGVAVASDRPTVFYPEHEEQTAAPGDTVDVDVFVDSDGGYGHVGLANLTLQADFETEYLRATNVSVASYLEEGEPTDVYEATNIDNDAGVVVAEQWRDPPREGATGNHQFATVTFEIEEDAPETNTTISFRESSAKLPGDTLLFVYEHNATLFIDEDAVSQDQSTPENGDGGESSGGTDQLDSDAMGTDVVVALVGALVVLVGLLLTVRRRS